MIKNMIIIIYNQNLMIKNLHILQKELMIINYYQNIHYKQWTRL